MTEKPLGSKDIRLIEDQPIGGGDGTELLGLEPFARVMAGVALGTTGPFTIGVYAGWGQGKTSLLKRTRHLVEAEGRLDTVAVWFNAWQYEREQQPLIPLVAAIVEAAEAKAKQCGRTRRDACLRENLSRLGRSLRMLGRGLKLSGKVGVPFVGKLGVEYDLGKALKAEEKALKRDDPLAAEVFSHRVYRALEDVTKAPPAGTRPKVIVFIDDLDRCLPDKALALLESIKLVLNQPGFIFLLALDPDIVVPFLAKRYRQQYGAKVKDAEAIARTYLHKIVQLQFDIPHHPERRFTDYITRLVDDRLGGDSPLKDIVDVLSASASRNPRALVRMLNNLSVDLSLWEEMEREWPTQEGAETWPLTDVLRCMVISHVLLNYLGAKATHALAMSDELYELPPPHAAPEEAEAVGPRQGAPDRRSAEADPSAELAKVRRNQTLHSLLYKFGQVWLRNPRLRQRVYQFYEERDTAWTASETEQAIFDRAVRNALGLEPDAPIPPERLRDVATLDFSGESDFGDAGLRLVAGLPGLQELHLNRTQVSDDGLRHLAKLTNLVHLHLSGTRVTDEGLQHVESLTSLQAVWLDRTHVSDQGLQHLQNLASLLELWLNDTQVSDNGLRHLAKLTNLAHLHLSSTRVSDEGLQHLQNLTSLQAVWLNRTHVSDQGLQHLKSLTRLQTLGLSGTQVSDQGLQHLQHLTGLQTLDLGSTRVSDDGIRHLAKLTNLVHLHLSGTQVSDQGLQHLQSLTSLRWLWLSGTQVTDEGLQHLQNLTGLRTLNLAGTQISGEGLQHLQSLTSLQWLWLSGTQVSDEGLKHLQNLTYLQTLGLSGTQVSDEGLQHLHSLTSLRFLDLPDTQVSDQGLEHLQSLSRLQGFNLSRTQVSDQGLQHLQKLTSLLELWLSDTPVSDEGVKALQAALPQCQIIR